MELVDSAPQVQEAALFRGNVGLFVGLIIFVVSVFRYIAIDGPGNFGGNIELSHPYHGFVCPECVRLPPGEVTHLAKFSSDDGTLVYPSGRTLVGDPVNIPDTAFRDREDEVFFDARDSFD